MTREWAFRYTTMVWVGASFFFAPLILAWIKTYRRWWLREMNRNQDQRPREDGDANE